MNSATQQLHSLYREAIANGYTCKRLAGDMDRVNFNNGYKYGRLAGELLAQYAGLTDGK